MLFGNCEHLMIILLTTSKIRKKTECSSLHHVASKDRMSLVTFTEFCWRIPGASALTDSHVVMDEARKLGLCFYSTVLICGQATSTLLEPSFLLCSGLQDDYETLRLSEDVKYCFFLWNWSLASWN